MRISWHPPLCTKSFHKTSLDSFKKGFPAAIFCNQLPYVELLFRYHKERCYCRKQNGFCLCVRALFRMSKKYVTVFMEDYLHNLCRSLTVIVGNHTANLLSFAVCGNKA